MTGIALAASLFVARAFSPSLSAAMVLAAIAAYCASPERRVLVASILPLCAVSAIALSGASAIFVSAAAAALAVAAWLFESNEHHLSRALMMVATVSVVSRLMPFGAVTGTWPNVIVVVGTLAMLVALARARLVSRGDFAIVVLFMTVASASSVRASLIPLVAAVCIAAARRRSLPLLIVAALLAFICGKVALPLLLMPAGTILANAQTRVSAATLRVGACALLIPASAFVPPYAATMFLLTALLLFADELNDVGANALAFVALSVVALLPWSGAVAGVFPLADNSPGVLLIAIASIVVASADRRPALRHIGVALLAIVVFASPRLPVFFTRDAMQSPLRRGESIAVTIDPPASRVTVVASLTNGNSIPRGTSVGRVDALAADGKGFGGEIRVGDVADWGAFREEARRSERNGIPHALSGEILGSGRASYVNGLGTLTFDFSHPVRQLRISASSALPAQTQIVIERAEGASR